VRKKRRDQDAATSQVQVGHVIIVRVPQQEAVHWPVSSSQQPIISAWNSCNARQEMQHAESDWTGAKYSNSQTFFSVHAHPSTAAHISISSFSIDAGYIVLSWYGASASASDRARATTTARVRASATVIGSVKRVCL